MLVLDTDHLSELDRAGAAGAALNARLEGCDDEVATTIINAQEQLRGWLAQIERQRDPHRQIALYKRLQGRIAFFASGLVLPWDRAAADVYVQLRAQRLRVGAMDLKIASITLAHGATLLSRNTVDFEHVPELRVEDWLTG